MYKVLLKMQFISRKKDYQLAYYQNMKLNQLACYLLAQARLGV